MNNYVYSKVRNMDFTNLVNGIADIHRRTHAQAAGAVNVALTLRNWLIGAHIAEFELHGEDRAAYGGRLVDSLSRALSEQGVPTCERPRLYSYLNFYRVYPQIGEALCSEPSLPGIGPIVRSLTGQSQIVQIVQSLTGQSSVEQQSPGMTPISGRTLLTRLSFTHLERLAAIDDAFKRAFYETECIKGNWSVRELKRQVASLYFERSGLSRDQAKLSEMANALAAQAEPSQLIRDPYIFEFLGLRPSEALPEAGLEAALLEKLQKFLLELGHGFCFEASQKRLLIGGEHFFVDLVFYHRVLKCHVLVELKVGAFSHENLGQLNTYVTYFRTHEMSEGDRPPIGILLCTDKNSALAEYALAGMDNSLFVSSYQLALPKTETLRSYIEGQIRELGAVGQ